MQINTEAVIAKMTSRIGELESQAITFEVLADQLLAELAQKSERIAELEAGAESEAAAA